MLAVIRPDRVFNRSISGRRQFPKNVWSRAWRSSMWLGNRCPNNKTQSSERKVQLGETVEIESSQIGWLFSKVYNRGVLLNGESVTGGDDRVSSGRSLSVMNKIRCVLWELIQCGRTEIGTGIWAKDGGEASDLHKQNKSQKSKTISSTTIENMVISWGGLYRRSGWSSDNAITTLWWPDFL